MTSEQFQEYLQAVNEKALPLVPLLNCNACGYPIVGDALVITIYEPPRWLHPECDDEPADEPVFKVARVP